MADNIHRNAVFLDNEPFRTTTILRSVTDDLVSRFGSAESGQTNLDLLKAETLKSFRGGMFQRLMDDPEKASTIENAYYNRHDGNLYPTPTWDEVLKDTYDMNKNGIESWCIHSGAIYFSFKSVAGVPQIVSFYPPSNNYSAQTLNATMLNIFASSYIHLSSFGGKLFACASNASTGLQLWRQDSGTFVDVGDGFRALHVFNKKLYAIHFQSDLYEITNATTTPVASSLISNMGDNSGFGLATDKFGEYCNSVNFNNTMYIGLRTGLYRYDGTAVTTIIDLSYDHSEFNFKHMAVFNGRMYYTIKNRLYQFDGINIEEMHNFTDAFRIDGLTAAEDRLWISTRSDSSQPGTDFYTPGVTTYRSALFAYNGIGFYLYHHFERVHDYSEAKMSVYVLDGATRAICPEVENVAGTETDHGYYNYDLPFSHEFVDKTRLSNDFTVITSEIENNYPAVSKSLNGLLVNYGNLIASEAYFSVYAQYYFDDEWSSWYEIWNTKNVDPTAASSDYLLHEQTDFGSPVLENSAAPYLRVRFKITFTTTDATPTDLPYLTNFTLRYTIQPRLRYKWLLSLDLAGYDSKGFTTATNSDGAPEDRTSSFLRKIIYDVFRNKTPILLYDADFTTVKVVDEGTGDITVHGVDFFTAGDTIAVQNTAAPYGSWINRRIQSVLYDEVDNETQITLSDYGYRTSIGGAAHDTEMVVGAQVRRSHAVYIRNIRNERYILDSNSINDNGGQGDYSDIPSEITIDLIEV